MYTVILLGEDHFTLERGVMFVNKYLSQKQNLIDLKNAQKKSFKRDIFISYGKKTTIFLCKTNCFQYKPHSHTSPL